MAAGNLRRGPLMAKVPTTYYWDACVFLHSVSPDPAFPERKKAVEHWLDRAEAGEIRIVTSTITIAEVAFAIEEKNSQALDMAVEQDINALWLPGGPVLMVEYTRSIGLSARALIRAGIPSGRSLKPYDAVNLASASFAVVDEMHSFDKPLVRYATVASNLSFPIGEPPDPPATLFDHGPQVDGA